MRSRVMPGSSLTKERGFPRIALKSVDLPTLGRPTMTTVGSNCAVVAAKPQASHKPGVQKSRGAGSHACSAEIRLGVSELIRGQNSRSARERSLRVASRDQRKRFLQSPATFALHETM